MSAWGLIWWLCLCLVSLPVSERSTVQPCRGVKTWFHTSPMKEDGLICCHTCLMSARYLENKRRDLTRVTSYLLCSFPLWFLLYFQDKQIQRQRNSTRLGRAGLVMQHPNKLSEPWGGRSLAQDGRGGRRGRKWGRVERKKGREGKDETTAIRWSAEMMWAPLSGDVMGW